MADKLGQLLTGSDGQKMLKAESGSTDVVLAIAVSTFSLDSVHDKSLFCSGNMKELLLMMTLAKTATHDFIIYILLYIHIYYIYTKEMLHSHFLWS